MTAPYLLGSTQNASLKDSARRERLTPLIGAQRSQGLILVKGPVCVLNPIGL